MQRYTDKYGTRRINFEHYRISIRPCDIYASVDMDEAENRAMELLRVHLSKTKTEIDQTK